RTAVLLLAGVTMICVLWMPQMGILHTDAGRVTYPTLPGRWLHLFENIHQVVTAGATSAVPLEEIIAQLEMIESVQKQ
ncbi:MAG: hypothetical protein AAGA31_21345, partial [Bacteroidota bacterium]